MFIKIVIIISCYSPTIFCNKPPIHGRYTRDISEYDLLVPHKRTQDGKFSSFIVPHFFRRSTITVKTSGTLSKRSARDPYVTYGIVVGGRIHYLDLWPNTNFLSSNAILEKRDLAEKVGKRYVKKVKDTSLCYYTGNVRNVEKSRVALSACDGLIGYIMLDDRKYYIEPLMDHRPNKKGQHIHVFYRDRPVIDKRCTSGDNWEVSWKNRFRKEYLETGKIPPALTHTSSIENAERWLETCVVCDKKFINHHRGSDIELYVMTIMNMVADFYRDSSSGNEMELTVVRIIYLEKEELEMDLTISRNAEETLKSFCKWQANVNVDDVNSPYHHDIAILLTRYDICSEKMSNCGLLGLAHVGTACTKDQNCGINEDTGLNLGVVVAHEMGHVMGCSHDSEDISGCPPQAEDGSYHVMAPYIHLDTNIWSPCSKKFITTLFENDLGECLNDKPQDSLYKFAEMLPGSVYDADYQCNITFPGSTPCRQDPEDICKRLLCKTEPDSCTTLGEPPADGTKCGEKKWCYNLKCIEEGTRPDAINGGWGEWSEWGECSASCGGGVSYSERQCNNPAPKHKGRYCFGSKKKFKMCNTHACPSGIIKSFRAQQCSEHDNKPFNGKLYIWAPYYKSDDPCGLYCINKNFFSKLEPRVRDGTKCRSGSRDTCIGGVCRKVGCDWILDSEAVDDICGVCKGDGTQCKILEEVYKDPPGNDYTKVIMIPKGARNILIEELAPSENTIAVSLADEKNFVLNGKHIEQPDGDYKMAGTNAIYSHPEPQKEMLTISGPLQEELVFFVVFFKKENVGYKYKWAEPSAQIFYLPRYHWEFTEFETCSSRCGGGIQTARPMCLEEKAGRVDDSYCDPVDKPLAKTRTCNLNPCPTRWKVGKWSSCSGCKSRSGVRSRSVSCVRDAAIAGEDDVIVEDSECTAVKPSSKELCNSLKRCLKVRKRSDDLPDNQAEEIYRQTKIPSHFEEKPMGFYLVTFKDFNRQELKTVKKQSSINKKKFYPTKRSKHFRNRLRSINRKSLRRYHQGNLEIYKCNENNERKCIKFQAITKTKCHCTTTNRPQTLPSKKPCSATQSALLFNKTIEYFPVDFGSNIKDHPKPCTTTTTSISHKTKEKLPLDIGTIVKDPVEPGSVKVITVPLKQSYLALNLSDSSFQSMGDMVPDSIDTAHETSVTGEEAAKVLYQMQHPNEKYSKPATRSDTKTTLSTVSEDNTVKSSSDSGSFINISQPESQE